MQPSFPFHTQGPAVAGTAPPTAEDLELAMAINASLQSTQERPLALGTQPGPAARASTSCTNPTEITNNNSSASVGAPAPFKGSSSGWEVQEVGPSGNPAPSDIPSVVQTTIENPNPLSAPSAPPIADAILDDGPIHYPSIDSTPVDLSSPVVETLPATTDGGKEDGISSSCVICLDAPVEGACIPCGHMAGCMSCLNEIKAKKWGCPVCRAKIDQVIRLYAV